MTNTHRLKQIEIQGTEINQKELDKILADNNWDGKTIGEVLDNISLIEDSNLEKGVSFERLVQLALPLIKNLEIEKVKKSLGKDLGVDLIAVHSSGMQIAIQCKFFTTSNITFKKIDHVEDAALLKGIKEIWLVCGAKGLSQDAKRIVNKKSMKIIDMREYRDEKITYQRRLPRQPMPLQQQAIDAVIDGFANITNADKRGKLIMACGTGKTFIALRITEQIVTENANLLFIAPSIALVAQARKEWLDHTSRKLRTLVICSDDSAGSDEDIKFNEIAGWVTTDPQEIADKLKTAIHDKAARVTFCTYQSLGKLLIAQQQHGAPKFDMAIIDEAHRTTGVLDDKDPGFLLIHDKEKLQIDKRLYMTATERIYKESKSKRNPEAVVVDMKDSERYGKQFHRRGFKDAVEAEVLCDYQVIAMGIPEGALSPELRESLIELNDDLTLTNKSAKGKAADDQSVLALFAISLAINGFSKGKNAPGVIARTIVYTSNIRRSKWLQRAITKPQTKQWVAQNSSAKTAGADKALNIEAIHLDGTANIVERNEGLQKLNDDSSQQNPHLITNAKLFTEGVDVPSLNAIAFLDPRDSKIDTVQAVGRVMRRDPKNKDKVFGYIIVPVILPDNADLIQTLEQDESRFKSLGNVLRALRSHDERLDTDLRERLTITEIKPRPPGQEKDELTIQESLLDDDTLRDLYTKIAVNTGLSRPGKQIADAITEAINAAANIFIKEGVTQLIADTIGTPSDNEQESCKTAALLIVNACIMHKRLEETGNLAGLTRIEDANNANSPASALSTAWFNILKKDYAPIFLDATALLDKLAERQSVQKAIHRLAECAINEATTLNDLGFDHAGPLYHKILGTAQSDGAFYTKNLSAYLLAGLAFDDNFTDWSDMASVKKLRIADPACGTGTLLMAALKAIKDKATKAQGLTPEQTEALHKHLVENTIHGYDINKYSIQLAACNLTIGAPNTDYARMNLHTLQHGPVAGVGVTDGELAQNVRHGSLEMLLGKTDMNELEQAIAKVNGIYGTNAGREKGEVKTPENLDMVIYNPPFTETLNQSKKYSSAAQQAMADRLGQVREYLAKNDPDALKSIAKRSIRPYFTPLANKLLSPSKGTMAEIVPTTFCTAENGREERQYIAEHHRIDMVITSHDPKHINFSENTSIHESMIIARRGEHQNEPTRFIQLAKYPENVKDAEELVEAIQSGKSSDLFTETPWQREKVQAGNWSPVQWMNPQLAKIADEMNTMANTVEAGIYPWRPDGQPVRVNFDYARSDDGDVFCTIDENVMQTIQAKPESKGTPKKGKEGQVEKLWQQADHVLVATRFSTTSSRLTGIYSEQPALGSAFRPIGVGDKQTAKAMATFMNSSFGIIQMLNRRTRKLTYPAYEAGHMKTLRLPDPKADLSPLLKAFEKVKHESLSRLSECHTDPSRKILDYAAAEVVGIDPKITDQWREWLSAEPTINNKPWKS